MHGLAALLLVAALASYAWFVRGGGVGWPRPHAPWHPSRRFERIVARTFLLFGIAALAVLVLAGRGAALWRFPHEFLAAQAMVGGPIDELPIGYIAVGVGAGALIGATFSRLTGRQFELGTIEAVMPRARNELGWGVILSFVAGVSEELYFRLALPLLIALVTGSATAAFVAALALFGVAHRYQGWKGVIATLIAGAVMTWAYLVTQSLWSAIMLHILVDLNGLVLRPVLTGRLKL